MIQITLDLITNIAKASTTSIIRVGVAVPIQINCVRAGVASSPGTSPEWELGIGTDAAPPVLLAYANTFSAENDNTFIGVLNASDARLVAFMASKSTANLNCQLQWTVGQSTQAAPNFPVTVQPSMIQPGASSEGGPTWATVADTLIPEPSTGKKYRLIFNEAGELSREEVV